MPTVNLFQVPLVLHVVGDRDHLKKSWGIEDIVFNKWKLVFSFNVFS